MADLELSIPSMVDGLTPGQRKILFCAFEMNLVKGLRVDRLSRHVSQHSAYQHGEAILASTIIRMAQDFVGSNNLSLLKPNGQFGTRYLGGEDNAGADLTFIQLSPITRYLFPKDDDISLDYLNEGGRSIEPTWYVPVIPTVLVNGSQGIGTGLSTYIPNYNPRDIIANIRRLLDGEPMEPMAPWYKGFRGTIEKSASKGGGVSYNVTGVIEEIDETTLCITELPIGQWTWDYDYFLRSLIGNDRAKDPFIEDVRSYSDVNTVHYKVILSEENLAMAKKEGLLKKFKLTTKISTSKMHLFDSNGVIKRYDTPEQILDEFLHVRLPFYEKRKKVLVANLESELLKLENKVRFIRAVGTGEINVFGKRAADLFVELYDKGFTPFPNETKVAGESDDYEYLLSMATGAFTVEKFEQLCAERDHMISEVDKMKKATHKSLWMKDLDALEIQLDAQDECDKRDEARKVARRNKTMSGLPKCSTKNTRKDSKEETDNAPKVAKPRGNTAAAKKGPTKKAAATVLNDEDDANKTNSPPEQSHAISTKQTTISVSSPGPDTAPKVATAKGKAAAAKKAPSRKGKAATTVWNDEDDANKINSPPKQSLEPDSAPKVANPKGKATAAKKAPTRKQKVAAIVLKDKEDACKINSSHEQSQEQDSAPEVAKPKGKAAAAKKGPAKKRKAAATVVKDEADSIPEQSQAMETEGPGRKARKGRAESVLKKPVALTETMTLRTRTRGTAMTLR